MILSLTRPYSETFETGLGYLYNVGPSATWLVHSGATSTVDSGPKSSRGDGSTHYAYIDATHAYPNKIGVLQSPPIVPEVGVRPLITFYFHMYGRDSGSLYVDLYYAGFSNWTEGKMAMLAFKGVFPVLPQTRMDLWWCVNMQAFLLKKVEREETAVVATCRAHLEHASQEVLGPVVVGMVGADTLEVVQVAQERFPFLVDPVELLVIIVGSAVRQVQLAYCKWSKPIQL
eukprot:gene19932-23848_t